MAMVNMSSLLNGKDSRWLQLEVCREFQRNKCTRQDTECKFAHPPANVEVQNGKVTACYDSIKGRCNRDKPPCKYFHPPQHLKDQLLINGRNHLALKNALMQQMGIPTGQQVLPGQMPTVATNPYLTSIPNTYNPYFATGHLVPTLLGPDPSQLGQVVQQAVPVAQQKLPRSDRLEAFSGMVPYKRPAADKSGIPVYQPAATATTYQQLMQLQHPYVPVSSASSKIPLNASHVIYTDTNGQLLDTLPVCQDFNRSMCSRLNCRFVHLTEDDKVEVCDQRVAVCRDHANGQCRRKQCKYYHIPVILPPADVMATIIKPAATTTDTATVSEATNTIEYIPILNQNNNKNMNISNNNNNHSHTYVVAPLSNTETISVTKTIPSTSVRQPLLKQPPTTLLNNLASNVSSCSTPSVAAYDYFWKNFNEQNYLQATSNINPSTDFNLNTFPFLPLDSTTTPVISGSPIIYNSSTNHSLNLATTPSIATTSP